MPPKKEKHSAYRSMKLAAEGKTKPTTKENKGALKRWTDEKWVNLTAKITDKKELPCGTKGKKQGAIGSAGVDKKSVSSRLL